MKTAFPDGVRMSDEKVILGVAPRERHSAARPLLSALERLFPARFVACDREDLGRFDAGLLWMEARAETGSGTPPCGRLLVFAVEDGGHQRRAEVRFSANGSLGRALAGQHLVELLSCAPGKSRLPGTVLAEWNGAPAWTRTHTGGAVTDWAGMPPPYLSERDALAEHWGRRSFMRLLPLLCFLKEVTASHSFDPPPPRACFVFDDPNLRGNRYGYLHFQELATHAAAHDYHVAIATVPLDAWLGCQPGVARLFREHPEHVSLAIHGNNHTFLELQRLQSEKKGVQMLAQARLRMDRFARQQGLDVSNVMDSPHGSISASMFKPMVAMGYEAALVTASQMAHFHRGIPWMAGIGLDPMDVLPGGLCSIPRIVMSEAWRTEAVLAAFLGQPVVIAGHHGDAAQGLDFLAEIATLVRSVSCARWTNLQDLARSRYRIRREGIRARIQLGARIVDCVLPDGVYEAVIERPWAEAGRQEAIEILGEDGVPEIPAARDETGAVTVSAEKNAGKRIRIVCPPAESILWQDVTMPHWSSWPVFRRILVELRDQIQPYLSRRKPARTTASRTGPRIE